MNNSTMEIWLKEAKRVKATHIISVCDTWDYEDYPVYVLPGESLEKVIEYLDSKSLQPQEQATEKGRVPDIQPMLDQAYNTAIDHAIKEVGAERDSYGSNNEHIVIIALKAVHNNIIQKLEALKTKTP